MRSRCPMKKIRFRYMYLKYGFNGTPWSREYTKTKVGGVDCARKRGGRSDIRREPVSSSTVDAASEIESRRETISFFPSLLSPPPPLPVPFFVERASHGGREWNKDVLRVTINAATLAQEGESNADDEHG